MTRLPAGSLLLITGSMESGGAARQLADMANFWARKDIDTALATWSGAPSEDAYPLDARVVRLDLSVPNTVSGFLSKARFHMRRVRKLRDLLMADRPKAILSFITESNVLTILAARGLGIRTIVSERVEPSCNVTLARTWRVLRSVTYARADAIAVQTRSAATWIARHLKKEATVIPNSLRKLPDAVRMREPLVLAVGRLAHQKGFDVLIRAFADLSLSFPEWSLVIVGEGPERARLEQLRAERRLDERVSLPGQVSNVEDWLARATLVVQPSRYEGFPNAVLEAMGMGVAVISTDCRAGPSDIIDHGVNGMLVPVDDVVALAGAMSDLMSQPDVRARLGSEALAVRHKFRQDRLMTEWEAVLFPCEVTSKGVK